RRSYGFDDSAQALCRSRTVTQGRVTGLDANMKLQDPVPLSMSAAGKRPGTSSSRRGETGMANLCKHFQVGQIVSLQYLEFKCRVQILAAGQPGLQLIDVGPDFLVLEDAEAGVKTRLPLHLISFTPVPVEQPVPVSVTAPAEVQVPVPTVS